MQILKTSTKDAVSSAVQALAKGDLVIYPTETCYGIAVDATNEIAVTKLLAYKGDRHRQVAVAVADRHMAEQYVNINEIADNLYTHFLPGPITVISDSKHIVDRRLESASGTLGVRIPKHDFALALIKVYGKPITATSANTSGKKEPYSIEDWQKYTTVDKQAMVTLFLDGGKLANRPTSTVVDTTLNDPQILRQGEITLPALDKQSVITKSAEETQTVATQLLNKYLNLVKKYPLIFALQGDLGAGKTQFSKGLAKALDINETVASPTYTLMHEYAYKTPKQSGMFYHLDTWRLPDPVEIETTLHLSKLLKPGVIISMEWAGKAKDVLEQYKNDYPILLIDIKEKGVNTRQISYAFSTPEWS